MNSWRWNELEEDVLDELPHVCQIIYLRIMRKHMDYSTGIVGRTRRISYEQIKERLRYTPPPQSREKAVEYSTDQVKKLIRKLVDVGLLERLHDTSKGVQPMEFRLPLASTDLDSQGHDRATVTGPRKKPRGYGAGKGNRATTGPRENAPQGHPSGSGKPHPLTTFGGDASNDSPKLELAPPNGTTEPKPKSSPKPKATKLDLTNLPEGVSVDAAQAFIDHRKALKKPLTQRALTLALGEAVKASQAIPGMTPDQAIDEAILAGWQGVKAQWLINRQDGNGMPTRARHDGRKGFVQPKPVGTYTPTDMDNLPDWMRD